MTDHFKNKSKRFLKRLGWLGGAAASGVVAVTLPAFLIEHLLDISAERASALVWMLICGGVLLWLIWECPSFPKEDE